MNNTIKLSLIATLFLSTNLIAEEKLEDITVTSATKTNQKLQEVTSNINVITAQEIEERHYTTVTEALNSLPGVNFTANGGLGQSTSVRVRGFDTQKLLVMVDGIRYNDITNSSGANFSDLMVSDIERIEVIKGAQSGIWGADAAAGVINIITKEAQKGLHFSASQEFGSFATSKSNLKASYQTDRGYIQASHNRVNSKGFSAQAPKDSNLNDFEDDGYNNKTTNLKAGFSITPTNKIDISHTIIDANSNYDNSVYVGVYPNSTLDPIASANSIATATNKTTLSSVNFNHIDSFNEVDIYAKQSTFKREYPQGFTKLYEGEVKEYGAKSKIDYLGDNFVVVGGDYKKFEHKDTVNKSFTNKALFVTNNNKFNNILGGTTILNESLRYDTFNNFDNKTTGKIGLKYQPNAIKELSTSLNYGTAYSVPSSFQLYSFYGNPNMKAEDTKSFDASIAYKGLSLTYFKNDIDNLIGYDTATSKYANINGTSTLKGYEVAYNTTLFDTLALSLGYSKLSAKDKDNKDLKRRAKDSVKFGIDYYGIEALHLGLNGEYIGERKDTDFATYSEVDTGKYLVANFVANYEVDKQLSFYGKVDNISDKTYQSVFGYSSSPRAFYGGMKLSY